MIRIHKEREKHKRVPLLDGMSFIEKFVMIMGPIGITYMIFIMSEFVIGFSWWIRLGISVGIMTVLFILIFFISDWLSRKEL